MIILNSQDYIDKMEVILYDSLKFWKIGPPIPCDDTNKIEARVQIWLLSLYNLISIMYRIRSVRSRCPRMYGLPKVQYDNLAP